MIRILLSTRLGEKRISQAELSRITGIRPNTISELYHELSERISLEHLSLICQALDCNVGDLLIYDPKGNLPLGRKAFQRKKHPAE